MYNLQQFTIYSNHFLLSPTVRNGMIHYKHVYQMCIYNQKTYTNHNTMALRPSRENKLYHFNTYYQANRSAIIRLHFGKYIHIGSY